MYCRKCGAELDDKMVVCPYCAEPTQHHAAQTVDNTQEGHSTNKDTICPHCNTMGCTPLQKNTTKITNSNFNWSSGCCGLLLMGPFGLLCGLCGKGTKVDIQNETWWICMKCGRQHISRDDAVEKGKKMLYSSITLGALIAFLAYIILQSYNFGMFFVALVSAITPIILWYRIREQLSGELGVDIMSVLTSEEKKECKVLLIASFVVTVIVGLFGYSILLAFIE